MLPKIISAIDLRKVAPSTNKNINLWATDLQKDFLGNAYLVLTEESNELITYKLDPYLNLNEPHPVGEVRISNRKDGVRTRKIITLQGTYLIEFNKNYVVFEGKELKIKANKLLLKENDNFKYLFLESGRNTDVVVIDQFQGILNKFTIKTCSIKRISCSQNLCLVECPHGFISISPEGHHPLIDGLKPLLYCRGDEYYYDPTNNTVVKYRDEELTPLMRYKPAKALCLGKGTILLSDGANTSMIDGILGFRLHDGAIDFMDGYGSLVILTLGKEDKILGVNTRELRKYLLTGRKCVVDSQEVTYCLSRDLFLTSLDLNTYVEEGVKPLKGEVSRNNYAIVEIRPWGPSHSYTLIGPVKIVSTFQTRNTLRLSVRPVRLGWRGKVLVSVKSPVYEYQGSFMVKSHAPIIKGVKVSKCLYSSNGVLGDKESNLSLFLNVILDRKAPEGYRIKVSSDDLEKTKVLWQELTSNTSTDVWSLEIWGRVKKLGKALKLSIFTESAYETSHVGDLYLGEHECLEVHEPPHKLVTEVTDSGLRIMSGKYTKLRAYCSSRSFEKYGGMDISNCFTSPILIEEYVSDGNFGWVKQILVKTPLRVKFYEGSRYRVINGSKLFRIEIPKKPNTPKLLIKEARITGGKEPKMNILFNVKDEIPSLKVIFCGGNSEVVYRRSEGEITCDLIKALNGLHVLALYPGLRVNNTSILHVDGVIALKKVVINAVKVANELMRRL